MRAQITPLPERVERTIEVDAHVRRIQELIEKALSLATGLSEELRGVVMNIDDPLRLAYVLATLLDMKPADKQALLEENDLLKKLEAIAAALTREVSLLELKGKIESQAQQEMTDAQRQYYLRQQLKAIQQELGEGEGNELAELRKRIEDAKLPEAVHTRRHARGRSPGADERGVARVPDAADLHRLAARRALVGHDRRTASIRSKRAGSSTRTTTTSTRSRSASSSTWPSAS